MKHLFLFLLFLLPVLLSAQDPLPANPRKLRLGYQTDGEGIVLYGSGVPSYTPTRYRSAFHYMDTTNNIYYQYNRIEAKWDTILAGAGAVADGVAVDNSTWSKIGGTDVNTVQTALNRTDSVLNNITVDGSQIQNKFEATTTTLTVSADTLSAKQDYSIIVRNSTPGNTTRVLLPRPTTSIQGERLIVVDSSDTAAATYFEVDTTGGLSGTLLYANGELANRVYLSPGERVELTVTNGVYAFNRQANDILELDVADQFYSIGKASTASGGQYVIRDYPQRQISSPYNPITDSIFIRPLRAKVVGNRNWVRASEQVQQFGLTASYLITDISVLPDAIAGPTGEITAEGLILQAAVGRVRAKMFEENASNNLIYSGSSGDTITLSYWAKVADAASNNNITIAIDDLTGFSIVGDPVACPQLDTINKEWKRYSVNLVLDGNTSTVIPRLDFEISGDVGDTLYLTKIQVEEGSKATRYKKTIYNYVNRPDTVYAYYRPVDGIIRLDDVYIPEIYNDNTAIQAAIDYCLTQSDCDIVDIGYGRSITEIQVPEGVSLRIGSAYVDTGDPTKDAITIYNPNAPTGNTDDVVISGSELIVRDTCRAVINMGSSNNCRVAGTNDNFFHIYAEGGIFDSLFQYGVYHSPSGLAGTKLYLDNMYIENAEAYAVYANNLQDLIISKFKFLQNDRGIYHNHGGAAKTFLTSGTLENHQGTVLYNRSPNGEVYMRQVYFENVFSYAEPLIHLRRGESARIAHCKFNALGSGTATANIRIDSFRHVTISGNDIANSATFLSTDCTYKSVVISAAVFNPAWKYGSSICNPNQIQIIGSGASGGIRLSEIEDFRSSRAILDSVQVTNLLADTVAWNNAYWKSSQQNLFIWSDSLDDGVATGWTVYKDSINDPFGDKRAELIVFSETLGSERPLVTRTISGMQIGNTYTVSFWAKQVTGAGGFEVYAGTNDDDRRAITGITNTEWVRYVIRFTAQTAGNLIIELGQYDNGDAISVTGFQVRDGLLPGAYIRTTSTAINSTEININSSGPVTIDSLDNRAFDGGELYILPTDPDTLDFSAAGGLFDQIQDMTIGTLDNFTSSGDTLYYTGSVTRPFTVNFTATLEADTGSQELQMRITKNAASLDKCTVSKDYSTSGVDVQITGTCRLDLSTNDAIALEVSPTQNTSQLLVRRANINLH